MIRALTSILISIALAAALIHGNESLSQFALIVFGAFNVLGWLVLLTGSVKGEYAAKLRKRPWMIGLCGGIQISALIVADHPWLAASYLLVDFLTLCVAFDKGESSCEL